LRWNFSKFDKKTTIVVDFFALTNLTIAVAIQTLQHWRRTGDLQAIYFV